MLNRNHVRGRLKITNNDINRLLSKVGEDTGLHEFSPELFEKLESALKDEKQPQVDIHSPVTPALAELLKLLAPLQQQTVNQLKEAHSLLVTRALEEFSQLQPELLKEELQKFAENGGWHSLKQNETNQIDPTTIDIEAKNTQE